MGQYPLSRAAGEGWGGGRVKPRHEVIVRLCIFGAGSVGGYLAGFLAKGGADVSVVARGAHLAAIRANGLTVETPDGAINVKLPASDDPAELGPQDVVIVAVKAPALPAVAATIDPLLGPETSVAFAMNGIPWWYFHAHGGPLDGRHLPRLDPGDALWNTIGPQRAIGGIFWPACSVPAPGVVRLLTGAGRGTVFGEPDGSTTPRIESLAAAFRAAGLPVTIAGNIRELIWQKLAFNLSAGPMCVLTQSPVRATHEEPALIECSRRMLAEAEAIALAMGYRLDIDVERVVATNTQLAHRPSILQDLEAGRPMEIDALYTVPLDIARMMGVPAPTLDLLVSLIRVKARAKGLYDG
jgi:2-dehydropantoate 2-reductase